MKYTRFPTLAAVFAIAVLAGSPSQVAAAKSQDTLVHAQETSRQQSATMYAAAEVPHGERGSRLDAQPVSLQSNQADTASASEAPTKLDTLTLVVAGLAAVGSLALRRSPRK